MPEVGTSQLSPPPPPNSLTLPLIVLACTITPRGLHALRLPKTWLLPDNVPPVAALGSSVQGCAFASQPIPRTALLRTFTLPSTVRLLVPEPPGESFNAKVAFKTDPGDNVRLPKMVAAPPSTAHTPETTTLEWYVPASTPGASRVPVQVDGLGKNPRTGKRQEPWWNQEP